MIELEDSVRWRSPTNELLYALNRLMTDGQNQSLNDWAIRAIQNKVSLNIF